MITKDQIIGTVWRLFDLQPRPLPEACKMAMDMYCKAMAMDFGKFIVDRGLVSDGKVSEGLFDLYLQERHQLNPNNNVKFYR